MAVPRAGEHWQKMGFVAWDRAATVRSIDTPGQPALLPGSPGATVTGRALPCTTGIPTHLIVLAKAELEAPGQMTG